jgi:hypothetical protein
MKNVGIGFLLVLLLVSSALACDFDTDCDPGSKCIRAEDQLEGVCIGGISPGNKNDDQKGYNDPRESYGNTCQFDTDCDPGYVCVKGSGIDGTCMKGR